jgi:O-antigen/teichoic acid export membrane protein
MCAPIFLISSFAAVPRALVLRRLDWKWFNLSEVIQLMATSSASLTLAFAGLGSEALVLGALAGAVAETAVLIAVAPSGGPRWDWDSAKSIVRFGTSATVSGFTSTLQSNVTFLVLAGRTGPAQVGLFWRAYQIGVSYQSKISNITYRVAKPVLTRAARLEDLRELHNRLLRINTTLIVPLLALLAVLAPDVVPWVFGRQWTEAVVPTQVLAVVGIWTLLIAAFDPPLMAIGRPDALAVYNLATLVVTGAAAWFTAPLGITAVAVGMVVSQGVLLLAGQFFLLRGLVGVPMRESLGVVAPAFLCSGILVLVAAPTAELLRTSMGPLAISFITGLLGVGVYAVSLRVLSPSSWRDLGTLFERVLGARRLRPWARRQPQPA